MIRDGRPVEVSDVSNNETVRRLVEQRAGLLRPAGARAADPAAGPSAHQGAQGAARRARKPDRRQAQKTVRTLENDAAPREGATCKPCPSQLDRQKSASGNVNETRGRSCAPWNARPRRSATFSNPTCRAFARRRRAPPSRICRPTRGSSRGPSLRATPYFPKKLPIITDLDARRLSSCRSPSSSPGELAERPGAGACRRAPT